MVRNEAFPATTPKSTVRGEYEEIDWTVQNRVRSPWDVGLMRIYAWSFAKGHARSNEPNPFEMLVLLTAMT